jgi:RecJ-like exonuclease
MSDRCPNVTKSYNGKDPRTRKTVYKCKVTCMICKGVGRVEECPDCQGAGLRSGGFPCNTCGTCGKVPSLSTLQK